MGRTAGDWPTVPLLPASPAAQRLCSEQSRCLPALTSWRAPTWIVTRVAVPLLVRVLPDGREARQFGRDGWHARTHARRGIDRSATEARRERPARARNLHTIATAWHFRLWRDGAGEGRAKPLNVYISRIKKYISLCFKLSAGPPAPQAAPRAVGRDIYRTCTAKHRQFARGGVPLAEYTEHISI